MTNRYIEFQTIGPGGGDYIAPAAGISGAAARREDDERLLSTATIDLGLLAATVPSNPVRREHQDEEWGPPSGLDTERLIKARLESARNSGREDGFAEAVVLCTRAFFFKALELAKRYWGFDKLENISQFLIKLVNVVNVNNLTDDEAEQLIEALSTIAGNVIKINDENREKRNVLGAEISSKIHEIVKLGINQLSIDELCSLIGPDFKKFFGDN